MTPPDRKGSRAGPMLVGFVLALPVGLGAGWLLWGRPPLALLETRTVRGYALLLGTTLLAAGLSAFARRRPLAGGTAVGILLLLASGFAAAHSRFHGWLSLGDGEPGANYVRVSRGPGGARPRVAVAYAAAEEEGRHVLTVAGRAWTVRVGDRVWRPGVVVRLSEVHVAPAFTLAREDGSVEDELLVKLTPSDPPGQHFQMSVLPYRFFATVEKPGPGPASPPGPGRIGLRVTRGKLTVARGTIAPGEALSFEGFRLSWREGAPWAVLEVWSVPVWVFLPLLAGLVLLAACTWPSVRARRQSAGAGSAAGDSPPPTSRDDG